MSHRLGAAALVQLFPAPTAAGTSEPVVLKPVPCAGPVPKVRPPAQLPPSTNALVCVAPPSPNTAWSSRAWQRRETRYALPGSALAHALMLGAGLLLLAAPEPDAAPAMQSLSVELITIASVSPDQTSIAQSDATETLVSAGVEALPTPPEPIEPEIPEPPAEPEPIQPPPPDLVEPIAPVEMTPPEPVEIVAPEPEPVPAPEPKPVAVAALSTPAPEPLETDAATPAAPPPQQPAEVANLKIAPTPHLMTRPRPSAPTQRPRQQQAQPRPAAPAGNGGQNQADAVAAKPSGGQQGNSGAGGDAETARYPSQVLAKLRRALRYPRGAGGASGEVQVQFTVSAAGQPSGLRIVKSSGNAAIDQAGMDTVLRAAPFPPIPAGANRSKWDFTVPLAFVRG